MRQLLDLASENTVLKRELAQVRGEAMERTQIDAMLAEARDL